MNSLPKIFPLKTRIFIDKYCPLILITLAAVIIQGIPLLLSYISTPAGLNFIILHDSAWHLALIEELSRSLPPTNPGFALAPLRNYHYLSDLFLLFLRTITHTHTWFVYFRLGPILASFFFTLTTYLVLRLYLKKTLSVNFGLILILFGNSFAWMLPFLGIQPAGHSNSFMLDQPVDLLTNVHTYFGLGLFWLGLYFFKRGLIATEDQIQNRFFLAFGIIAGLSFGIKAYASLIMIFSLGAVVIHQLVSASKYGWRLIFFALLPALGLLTFNYLLTMKDSGSSLIWSPGWLLDKMVEDGDRLIGLKNLNLRQQYYQATNQPILILMLYLLKLVIYLLGNLGVRILGLIPLTLWLCHFKKLKPDQVFIIVSTTASLLIPVLFHQGVTAYNIVQFGVYGLLLASLATAIFIESVPLSKLSANLLIYSLFLLAIPTTVKNTRDLLVRQPTTIPWPEIASYQFLSTQTPARAVILTHPESNHFHLPLIPGLALRRTYFSADTFAEMTNNPLEERLEKSNTFFSPLTLPEKKLKFLKDAKIDYIYLDPAHLDLFFSTNLPIKEVFRNSSAAIYQVIK